MNAWEALVRGRLGGGLAALVRLCRDTLRAERGNFLPLVAVSLAAGLFAAIPPLVISRLVDAAVAGVSFGLISLAALGVAAAFAALALADAGFTWLRHRYAIRAQRGLRSRIVPGLFATGLRQPVARLQENSRAAMIRSFDDLDESISFFTATVPEFIASALLVASYAVLLAAVDPLLAAIVLCATLLAFLTAARLARRSQAAFAAWLLDRDSAFTRIVEAFAGLLTIKAMSAHGGVQAHFLRRLEAENASLARMREATAAAETASRGWTGFMPGTVVVFGVWMVGRGTLTVGELVLFLSVTASLAAPVASLCLQWEAAQRTLAAIDRISALRASGPERLDDAEAGDWRPAGGLAAVGIRHRHAGAAGHALREANFAIEPGSHVAVTGRSGGGKTTLAHILARMIEPGEGSLRVGGAAAAGVGLSAYRRRIVMLPHETHLFTASIAMNIALWDPAYRSEEIEAAAQAAGLAGVVANLPGGYETELSADGEPLSAGQIQRIGIARALLRKPEILILDEATSALDVETEGRVMAAVREAMRGRTLIVVTHREELAAGFSQRLYVADGHVLWKEHKQSAEGTVVTA